MMSRRINASLAPAAGSRPSASCARCRARRKIVFSNKGHRPDRKISTMAGVSPMPKKQHGHRDQRDWRHRAEGSGSTSRTAGPAPDSARSKDPTARRRKNARLMPISTRVTLANVLAGDRGSIDRKCRRHLGGRRQQHRRIEMRGDPRSATTPIVPRSGQVRLTR